MELAASVSAGVKSSLACGDMPFVANRVLSFSQELWQPGLVRARVKPLRQHPRAEAAAGGSWQSVAKKKLTEAPRLYHRVEEGDTLFSIAKQYNTTMRSIALANDVSNIDMLRAGQLLIVPVLPGGFSRVRAVITEVSEPLMTKSVTAATADAGRRTRAAPLAGVAKFAVPMLLLAPILGFCARCVVDMLKARALEAAREQLVVEAKWDAFHRDQLSGWKGRMDELKSSEPPPLALASGGPVDSEEEGAEVALSSQNDEEDREMYESYAELESSYRKFLVDSGLSEPGYMRHTSTR